ncbi:7-carboxy-7-deazaguanine synthase QueE [Pseudophaeobacter flagellatus]|uniref:7-carboxy-7-deazaguanine synthase QueE n=1 Tax=Pseudophaeobacter flagellatus TaxID=2899119 RepID=UPI001E3EFB70|nr:7-carboxy-7-deazaguanine synthase QueE [Pseudophaeobacter flagellatus]MCD9146248.1 7-carboxy-7-deazaguanine synthase QueE [Pseudophaeobacter flagellatus]
MKPLRIAEIFGPTIQGEGAVIGVPTVFVRAGGCDYRCSWCDSLHAVDNKFRHDWKAMSPSEVFAAVERLSGGVPLAVSLSGGNPAIQDFAPLIELGRAKGYSFVMETQGSIAQDWFSALSTLILSPKPPSSGETVDWARFDACIAAAQDRQTVMKIVIFDEIDYAWARGVAAEYPRLPLYLQPGNHTPPPPEAEDAEIDMDGIMDRYEWLIDKTLGDRWYTPTILPQLHVLVWGNKRGV